MGPQEAKLQVIHIINALARPFAEGTLHPHFALTSLEGLVQQIKHSGLPLSAYGAGPWRAVELPYGPIADGSLRPPIPAVWRGDLGIVMRGFDVALDTAAVLNWCEGEDLPLMN